MDWLMNYDQPMILLGLAGGVLSAFTLGFAANTRSEYGPDTYKYKAAYKRTPKAITALISSALIFATGWALPNPEPTFRSAYEDCLWEMQSPSAKQQQGCIIVAKELVAELNKPS